MELAVLDLETFADEVVTQGGHFAALEQAELLLQDFADFLEKAWPKATSQ